MADNVVIDGVTVAGGPSIATDDVGGKHYQRIKVNYGPDGSAIEVDDVLGKRLPVDLGYDGAKIVLPSQISAVANGTITRATITGLGGYLDAVILISITASGTGPG